MGSETSSRVTLQYCSAELALRPPWHVVAGAVAAAAWVSFAGVWAFKDAVAMLCAPWVDPHWNPSTLFHGAMLGAFSLTCVMLLLLQWRAIFRRSAVAAATAGALLLMPAVLLSAVELMAMGMHRQNGAFGLSAEWLLPAATTSLGFGCVTQFRWRALIAKWRARAECGVTGDSGTGIRDFCRRGLQDAWCARALLMFAGVMLCYLAAYCSVVLEVGSDEESSWLDTARCLEVCIWRAWYPGATNGWGPFMLGDPPEGTVAIVRFGAWIPAALAAALLLFAMVYASYRFCRARR